MSGSIVPIDQNRPGDLTQAVHFGHNYPEASPPTPGRVTPQARFVRKVFNDKLRVRGRQRGRVLGLQGPGRRGQAVPGRDHPRAPGPGRAHRAAVGDQRAHDPPPRHRAVHVQRRRARHVVQRQAASTPTSGAPRGPARSSTTATATRRCTCRWACSASSSWTRRAAPAGCTSAARVRRRGAVGHVRRRPVLADVQPRVRREGRDRGRHPAQPLPAQVLHGQRGGRAAVARAPQDHGARPGRPAACCCAT